MLQHASKIFNFPTWNDDPQLTTLVPWALKSEDLSEARADRCPGPLVDFSKEYPERLSEDQGPLS